MYIILPRIQPKPSTLDVAVRRVSSHLLGLTLVTLRSYLTTLSLIYFSHFYNEDNNRAISYGCMWIKWDSIWKAKALWPAWVNPTYMLPIFLIPIWREIISFIDLKSIPWLVPNLCIIYRWINLGPWTWLEPKYLV